MSRRIHIKTMKNYYVYILRCSDNSYYVGVTNNIERRLFEHSNNLIKKCYTSSRLPIELVWCENFNDINVAIAFEKQIKKWSRKKKEALIIDDWDMISKLSIRYT